jgi:hypothetical protein
VARGGGGWSNLGQKMTAETDPFMLLVAAFRTGLQDKVCNCLYTAAHFKDTHESRTRIKKA